MATTAMERMGGMATMAIVPQKEAVAAAVVTAVEMLIGYQV